MSRQLRLFLWFMLGMLLGGFAATAKADYAASERFQYAFLTGWQYSEAGSQCAAAIASRNSQNPPPAAAFTTFTYNSTSGTGMCKGNYPPSGVIYDIANFYRGYYCPSGGTLSGTQCIVSCTAGQSSSATRHTGCYSVDGIDNGCDAGTPIPTPTALCDGSCWVNISGVSGCTSPSQGGPITCTYTGNLSGSSCSTSDIPPQPAPTDKCPAGYAIGSVNGVSGCYKTGSQPPETTTTTSSTSGDTTTTVKTTTNTTTNTTTTTTTTTNNVTGTTTTSTQITPTDPAKPILDPSQKSPGEDQTPWEIDESGTPTDGSLSAQKADYEAKATERKNYIESLGNQGNHGLTWDWAFELPGGTCTAYTFTIASKTFTLDPCDKLYMIRDILGFLIYITTALALLSIATGYGKEGK